MARRKRDFVGLALVQSIPHRKKTPEKEVKNINSKNELRAKSVKKQGTLRAQKKSLRPFLVYTPSALHLAAQS
jgi:hypothetical protein